MGDTGNGIYGEWDQISRLKARIKALELEIEQLKKDRQKDADRILGEVSYDKSVWYN